MEHILKPGVRIEVDPVGLEGRGGKVRKETEVRVLTNLRGQREPGQDLRQIVAVPERRPAVHRRTHQVPPGWIGLAVAGNLGEELVEDWIDAQTDGGGDVLGGGHEVGHASQHAHGRLSLDAPESLSKNLLAVTDDDLG